MAVSNAEAVSSALINPAFVQMSKDLKVTVEQASYCTTVFILFGGVTPMLIVPFANVYGRRVLYVVRTTRISYQSSNNGGNSSLRSSPLRPILVRQRHQHTEE